MITIIGAGNVGNHLYQLFVNANLSVKLISSKNKFALKQAISEFLPKEIIFITTVNKAIAEIEKQLEIQNQLVVHCSGADSVSILKSTNKAVFYPLQTFTKNKNVNWQQIIVYLQGSTENVNRLMEISNVCNLNTQLIEEEKRFNLHLAAVFVNNFTNALFIAASKILKNSDISALYPLILETIDKIKLQNPAKAQTGPAIRNDIITIENHLKLLKDLPLEKEIYKVLTNYIQNKT